MLQAINISSDSTMKKETCSVVNVRLRIDPRRLAYFFRMDSEVGNSSAKDNTHSDGMGVY